MDDVLCRPEFVTADNVFFITGRWYLEDHAAGSQEQFLADIKDLSDLTHKIPNKDVVGFGCDRNWGTMNLKVKTTPALDYMRLKGFMVWNADALWDSIVSVFFGPCIARLQHPILTEPAHTKRLR